jgi:hypothetical protein
MAAQVIKISGARQHNLKNLIVEIPQEKLAVIPDLGGPGKSSLASDTLYGEGQRRYIESLSTQRKFRDQMDASDATAWEEQVLYATIYSAGRESSLCFTEMLVGPCGNFWTNLPRNLACLTSFFSCLELIQLHD